jgi:hypothetical protein
MKLVLLFIAVLAISACTTMDSSPQTTLLNQIKTACKAGVSEFDDGKVSFSVFQLNPKSFPQYSVKQLKDPKLNIQLGIKYLAKMKKECKYKDGLNWLTCWNYGPKNAKKVKHPELFPYVKKIKLAMNNKEF